MTDEELIESLRGACYLAFDDGTNDFGTAPEAADRIEALTKERDEAINQLDSARYSVDVLEKRVAFVEKERKKTFQALLKTTKIHDEAEAKLAKAVEALEESVREFDCPIARAALAEIKGGNDAESNL